MIESTEALEFFEVQPDSRFPIKELTVQILVAAMHAFQNSPNFEDHTEQPHFRIQGTNYELVTSSYAEKTPYNRTKGRFSATLLHPQSGLAEYMHCIGVGVLDIDEICKVTYDFSPNPDQLTVRNTINTRANFQGMGIGRGLGWTMNQACKMIRTSFSRGKPVTCKIADESEYKGRRREWTSCLATELGFQLNPDTYANYPYFRKVI